MDFAAGDSCFYIGLGNTKTSTPSFEPYQCCPKPQPQAEKEKSEKPVKKEAKTSESKTNGKPDYSNKKKEKRNKKDNGKASWWW